MEKLSLYDTLHEVRIDWIWGLCTGAFIYEGCGGVLSDGRPCTLGKHKRRLRMQNPESPLGPKSRSRLQHTCSRDGEGTYMYCFAVQVGSVVLQVNEANGQQLMGISGQDYRDSDNERRDKIRIRFWQGLGLSDMSRVTGKEICL